MREEKGSGGQWDAGDEGSQGRWAMGHDDYTPAEAEGKATVCSLGST